MASAMESKVIGAEPVWKTIVDLLPEDNVQGKLVAIEGSEHPDHTAIRYLNKKSGLEKICCLTCQMEKRRRVIIWQS
jgi:hypothetical protein